MISTETNCHCSLNASHVLTSTRFPDRIFLWIPVPCLNCFPFAYQYYPHSCSESHPRCPTKPSRVALTIAPTKQRCILSKQWELICKIHYTSYLSMPTPSPLALNQDPHDQQSKQWESIEMFMEGDSEGRMLAFLVLYEETCAPLLHQSRLSLNTQRTVLSHITEGQRGITDRVGYLLCPLMVTSWLLEAEGRSGQGHRSPWSGRFHSSLPMIYFSTLSLLLLCLDSCSFEANLESGKFQSFPFVLLHFGSKADNRISLSLNLPIF